MPSIYGVRRMGARKPLVVTRRSRAMHRPTLVVGLVVAGLVLMANPIYLPVAVGEPTPAYAHVVQPVGPDTPEHTEDDVVDAAELDADARAAFDRALESPEGGFVVDDPDERVGSLSYPAEPTLGDGLLVVADDDARYEFRTLTVEREPEAVAVQRIVLQPAVFLIGFLSVIAGIAVGFRGRSA